MILNFKTGSIPLRAKITVETNSDVGAPWIMPLRAVRP